MTARYGYSRSDCVLQAATSADDDILVHFADCQY